MSIFACQYFLQYLLISWFRLFSSNSFNILRLFTKCHLLKLTFKNFTGLSMLQICVQFRNSMQIFRGSDCTFWTHQAWQVGWVGWPLGGRFHSLAGIGYLPVEAIEAIENVKIICRDGENGYYCGRLLWRSISLIVHNILFTICTLLKLYTIVYAAAEIQGI